MTKDDIYTALNPSWWITQTDDFNTEFVSTNILFDTLGESNCIYTSSAPIQTNGLNAGTSGIDSSDLIDSLRTEAAQRLFDMHATSIIGNEDITPFGAQA